MPPRPCSIATPSSTSSCAPTILHSASAALPSVAASASPRRSTAGPAGSAAAASRAPRSLSLCPAERKPGQLQLAPRRADQHRPLRREPRRHDDRRCEDGEQPRARRVLGRHRSAHQTELRAHGERRERKKYSRRAGWHDERERPRQREARGSKHPTNTHPATTTGKPRSAYTRTSPHEPHAAAGRATRPADGCDTRARAPSRSAHPRHRACRGVA